MVEKTADVLKRIVDNARIVEGNDVAHVVRAKPEIALTVFDDLGKHLVRFNDVGDVHGYKFSSCVAHSVQFVVGKKPQIAKGIILCHTVDDGIVIIGARNLKWLPDVARRRTCVWIEKI